MFLTLLILTAAVLFWGVSAYNSLIALKNQVANAWKQIDVQLKRVLTKAAVDALDQRFADAKVSRKSGEGK